MRYLSMGEVVITLIIAGILILMAGLCYVFLIPYLKWRKERAMARLYRALVKSIDANQDYYWRDEWQSGEAEARAELAAGLGRTFHNAQDAIRWLKEGVK